MMGGEQIELYHEIERMSIYYLLLFELEINMSCDRMLIRHYALRRYNDAVVQQLLSFRFAEERLNVGVYGVTEAGKSYFMSAFCNEACRRNYRCMYVDYCDLLDELLVLSRRDDLDKYRKKLRYYGRIQILFIDDFAISRYSEDGIKILYHLIKTRTDLKTSTMFTSQYAPSEWGKYLSDEEGCYGKLDGIRRRLTTGYTVHIEKL